MGRKRRQPRVDIGCTRFYSKAVELSQPGEIWGCVRGDKAPAIDAIQGPPSGSGYGLPMLSWAKPYLDRLLLTSERSHMTHSIQLISQNIKNLLRFLFIVFMFRI